MKETMKHLRFIGFGLSLILAVLLSCSLALGMLALALNYPYLGVPLLVIAFAHFIGRVLLD